MLDQTLDLPLTNCCYSQKLLSGHAIELKIEKGQQDLDFKFQNKTVTFNYLEKIESNWICLSFNSSIFFFKDKSIFND